MAPASNLRGIAFLLIGAGVFVLNDSLMKLAFSDAPPFQVLFMRGIAGCLWALPVIAAMGNLRDMPRALNSWVLLRGALEVGAILAFITALPRVPIGDLTAIFQTTPLIIVMGMALLHGERVGLHRWGLILMGFSGAMMVAQPGNVGASPYALLGFLVAFFAALRDLAGRRAPADIPVLVATFATMVLVLTAAAIAGALFETWVAPTARATKLMAAAGLFMMLGHMFTFLAFRHASAQAVAPFYYGFMIWAVALGYFIFGDVPNWLAVAGMSIVLASGLAVLMSERNAAAGEPPPM
jgi:drug/metabolite transporter (DMT)-like permease